MGDDFFTIEEYISGDFVKYINNTGELCTNEFDEFGQKAECLSHFSFEQSGKKLIVLDIQGSSASFYGPEVASVELKADGKVLFCAGNLSKDAVDNFVVNHVCNKYCEMLELEPLI